MEVAETFKAAVRLINDGFVKALGIRDGGTRVTVTMVAVDSNGAEVGNARAVEYFVHGDLPVMVHAGYVYSGLDDLDFEKIRVNDKDVFQLQGDENQTQSFGLFLSLPFHAWGNNGRFGVLGTLGTAVRDPGDSIFFGLSGRIGRLFITFGGSTAVGQASTKSTMVADAPEASGGGPAMVTDVMNERSVATFLSVSFALFEF